MRLGFYERKYWLRNKIKGLLPFFSNAAPSKITLCLIPIGILTALVYFIAVKYEKSAFYYVGILLIFLRMFFATLDGLVAEHFQKCSAKGELLNRIVPEACDVLYLMALGIAHPCLLSFMTLGISWLVSFSGLLPLLNKQKILQTGPLGQTDRLIALCFFSLMQPFFTGALTGFFIFCLLAGPVTFFIRLKKTFHKI